jgi:hypothetical protein
MNYSFFLGLGIGMTIGCLLAPRSGSDTRHFLWSKAQHGGDRLRSGAEHMRDRTSGAIERGRHMFGGHRHQETSDYRSQPVAQI